MGLVNTSWGGTICETWTSRPTLESDEDFAPILERAANFKPGNPNQGSVLYNGMINPIVPLSLLGAIWYQGESNVARAQQYAKLFPAMITDWRKNWGQATSPSCSCNWPRFVTKAKTLRNASNYGSRN